MLVNLNSPWFVASTVNVGGMFMLFLTKKPNDSDESIVPK